MAFASRTEVKNILGISATTWDTFIDAMLVIMPDFICDYCNNYFINDNLYLYASTLSFATSTVTDSDAGFSTAGFATGMDIYIGGSQNNDGLYNVTTAAAGSLIVNKTFTTEAVGYPITVYQVQYPVGLKVPVATMIGYLIGQGKNQGVQSESVGDYSVSFLSNIPDSIMKQFKAYKKVKWL